MKHTILTLAALGTLCGDAAAQGKRGPLPEPSQVEVYKTIDSTKLNMHIYLPSGHKAGDQRPAIVFFFGGGWRNGSPKQFAVHAAYFAARGMVAMAAEYRIYSEHKAKVADCVSDAKSAIRWARANANRLGIDPKKIVSSGGSAGGHLAAAVGILDGFDAPSEDASISSRSNAMILFNPALDLRAASFKTKPDEKRYKDLFERLGASPQKLSPNLHIKKDTPPAIIFHGKDDTSVPFGQAEALSEAMRVAGNRCELAAYDGQKHGFFNYGRDGNKMFLNTTTQADRFLESLGYLQGPPTLEEFLMRLK
jgi:acetyl esterase/lipase